MHKVSIIIISVCVCVCARVAWPHSESDRFFFLYAIRQKQIHMDSRSEGSANSLVRSRDLTILLAVYSPCFSLSAPAQFRPLLLSAGYDARARALSLSLSLPPVSPANVTTRVNYTRLYAFAI